MDVKEIQDCPDCGSTNIIQSTVREQVICRDCGLIFEPHVPLEIEKPAKPVSAPAKLKKAKAKKKPVRKKVAKKKAAAKKPKKKEGALKRLLKGFRKKK